MNTLQLNQQLGNIDIYLLDLILKGHYNPNDIILDAGCGEGRNLIYFLHQHFKVYGIDKNPGAIKMLQFTSRSINKNYNTDHFQIGDLTDLPYAEQQFNHIICSAVLHFSTSEENFEIQMANLSRILKPSGSLFIRTAAMKGFENTVVAQGNGIYLLPDKSLRFLITDEILDNALKQYGFKHLQVPKYVIVDQQRCMSTLLLEKQY